MTSSVGMRQQPSLGHPRNTGLGTLVSPRREGDARAGSCRLTARTAGKASPARSAEPARCPGAGAGQDEALAEATLWWVPKGHTLREKCPQCSALPAVNDSLRLQSSPSRIRRRRQGRRCGCVFQEEFGEAVVVPEVKIAFGAIRRWQTPWALTTGSFLGLQLSSLAYVLFLEFPRQKCACSGSPA